MNMNFSRKKTAGLYNPQNEHDSCGVGFIASIKGEKTHQIVLDGLKILENLVKDCKEKEIFNILKKNKEIRKSILKITD